ncbi:MAG: sodium:proton antiporter NhaD [Gammaproteobacteria bacterium]|nr:sodium:proton antiporter NhaD [Gammaproteobacteria bacterium]
MPLPLIAIIAIFCVGYLMIILEHNVNVDKAAPAVLTGVLCWAVYILAAPGLIDVASLPQAFLDAHATKSTEEIIKAWVGEHQMLEGFAETASILFFLLGAMTIVEMVDVYGGFTIITDRIRSTSMVKLLWIIGFVAFFMSAALDNLTTTIVMISLIRKLIDDKDDRLFFAGIIVIAANAGGAWSPIGDVTTTMLWIGGQITTLRIMESIFLPSLVCLAIPLLFLAFRLRGRQITSPVQVQNEAHHSVSKSQRNLIFLVGMGGLLFVPVFKTVTHLPPFMGMLFSLGVLWVVSELVHKDRDAAMESGMHILTVVRRIDTPSVLFFLGILTAVSALQATGLLAQAAGFLDRTVGNLDLIVFLIGLLSAVIDNVPLVAATMGMYDLAVHPTDSPLWEFLAFAAGTGGSCLIIGSAAGVAAMGMERINFFWYVRNISGLALMGYVAGSAVIMLEKSVFF